MVDLSIVMLVYQRVIGIHVDYCGLMGQFFHGDFSLGFMDVLMDFNGDLR